MPELRSWHRAWWATVSDPGWCGRAAECTGRARVGASASVLARPRASLEAGLRRSAEASDSGRSLLGRLAPGLNRIRARVTAVATDLERVPTVTSASDPSASQARE